MMKELPWTWAHELAFRVGTILLGVVILAPFVIGMALLISVLAGRL